MLVVKNPPTNARDVRDTGSIPELGGSPGGGHDNPLQHSCLENPMDRGAWRAKVHRVAESDTIDAWHSCMLRECRAAVLYLYDVIDTEQFTYLGENVSPGHALPLPVSAV